MSLDINLTLYTNYIIIEAAAVSEKELCEESDLKYC